MDKPQIHFIQALRAVAALMVLMWHFRSTVTGELESAVLELLFKNGFSGVDIFCVISGFIMVNSTSGKDGGAWTAAIFMLKRFSRIWPLYCFGTVLYMFFLWAIGWLEVETYKGFFLSLIFYPYAPHPILDVGWTLNIEMYFYFVFAMCLIFDRSRWIVASLWVAVTLLLQNTTRFTPASESLQWLVPYYNQAIHPCVLEFFAGMIIAAFYKAPYSFRKEIGVPVSVLLISFSIWQYLEGFSAAVGMTGIGIGATSLVLGFVVAEKSGAGWKPGKLIMWIGNISFSIYILHTIVGLSVTRLLNNYGMSEYTNGIGYLIFVVALVLLLSSVTYELIEKRFSSKFGSMLIDKFNKLRRIQFAY